MGAVLEVFSIFVEWEKGASGHSTPQLADAVPRARAALALVAAWCLLRPRQPLFGSDSTTPNNRSRHHTHVYLFSMSCSRAGRISLTSQQSCSGSRRSCCSVNRTSSLPSMSVELAA